MLGINKDKAKEFQNAEAAGHIKTMPASKANIVETKEEDFKVIDNPTDFQYAVGNAQMSGRTYLEVSDELFNYLVKNNNTQYLTYGNPGIKIFKEGTMEKILAFESLSPDEQAKKLRGQV